MSRYSQTYLQAIRNDIPMDAVITKMLRLDVRRTTGIPRFRCPICGNYHTAINPNTNLARCFDCEKNFNPIDLVMTVLGCPFMDAVRYLEKRRS